MVSRKDALGYGQQLPYPEHAVNNTERKRKKYQNECWLMVQGDTNCQKYNPNGSA